MTMTLGIAQVAALLGASCVGNSRLSNIDQTWRSFTATSLCSRSAASQVLPKRSHISVLSQ